MRLDLYLTEHGFCESRSKAQTAIRAGLVLVNGKVRDKNSFEIEENDSVTLTEEPMPFVGRGGLKLEAALNTFASLGITAKDQIAVDIGASTGGFTDCLLRHGAKKVYAVENGHGQLHPSLLADPRVVSLEKTDARLLTPEMLGCPRVGLVVMDVSFISQTRFYPAVTSLLIPDGWLIPLIKPQFEAGREAIGKNGVVKSETERQKVIKTIKQTAEAHGLLCRGLILSPITGGDGNIEYLGAFQLHET